LARLAGTTLRNAYIYDLKEKFVSKSSVIE